MALIAICLELELEPERMSSLRPEVRVWVDLQPERALNAETEVALTCHGDRIWRGAFAVPEQKLQAFTYRVGVYAHAGAAWSLVFRDTSRRGALMADADLLGASKAWFTGTCNLRGSRSGNARSKPRPNRLANRPCSLVLLDR
jgi:hypothetical protein